MDYKKIAADIVSEVRTMLAVEKQVESKKTFFEVATLEDGTVIGTESDQPFAIGDNILQQNADGTSDCAPNGDYMLPDGRTVTVADCTIKDIQVMPAEPTEEEKPAVSEIKQESELEISLKAEIKSLKDELELMKLEKISLSKQIEEINASPSTTPTGTRTKESSGENSFEHNKSLSTKADFYSGLAKIKSELNKKK